MFGRATSRWALAHICSSNYFKVPARLIKVRPMYTTIRVEKVASPVTALHPIIPASHIRVRVECGEEQTDRHTDRHTDGRGQYTFRLGCASREM